jgi:hypothetical protein
MNKVPCPFVYANGEKCRGHVVRVEAYRANLAWALDRNGQWAFGYSPRSHYHVTCSEKGNHAMGGDDDPRMKFFWDTLPEELRRVLKATCVSQYAEAV